MNCEPQGGWIYIMADLYRARETSETLLIERAKRERLDLNDLLV